MYSFFEFVLVLVEWMVVVVVVELLCVVVIQGVFGCNLYCVVLEYDFVCLLFFCFSFEDVLEVVQDGCVVCVMILIENLQYGCVVDIYFLLFESGLLIVGEYFLVIYYVLMGLIEGLFIVVYSYLQVFG